MKSSYIVNEGISSQELADVLFRRLEARYPDIVTNHGHEVVGDAVQNVASFHAGVEELGTSDIGIMLRQILKELEPRAELDEQDISEAVPPAKPDPFVFKSLNAADAYFRAVTHGDGMDVVTRYGKGDAGAYRQYLSKFVKPELDEQDWSTLPGHGSQKDTFSFDKWKNTKPVQKNDPASRLAAMGEPMVADWYDGGGVESVRDGLIDMATDRGIRWNSKIIDQALHILNIAPDNEFELTEAPASTDLSTLANKLLRGNAIKWKKEGQGLTLKLNLSIDQKYSILPKVTDRLKKLGFTVKKQEHEPDLGYKMPTSNTTEYSNGACKITVYVGRDYRREKNPVILNIIPNGQTEGLEEEVDNTGKASYHQAWLKKLKGSDHTYSDQIDYHKHSLNQIAKGKPVHPGPKHIGPHATIADIRNNEKLRKNRRDPKLEDSAHPANEAIDLEEDAGQPRVRKYTRERPDGTMMVRYEVLDHKGYRVPGQGPEGFDDLSTAKKFLRAKAFDLMAQRESKSAILSGVLLSK